MKKHLNMTFLLSFVFVMILTACTSPAAPTAVIVQPTAVTQATSAPTEAVVVQPTATQAAAATAVPAPVKLTDAEMEALIVEKLKGSPHTLEFVLSQVKTAEEWDKTLTKMIGNGAKINAEEKQLLIDWLSSRK